MAARILIAEDNPDNLKLMRYLLCAFGHTILSTIDGEAALEMAGREAPDLIVCDIQMPKLDGYEVARQLKAHPALGAIPLVAVTALAMVGDRDKVMAAGFDGYITKPIGPRTFVGQVEAFLPPSLHSQPRRPVQAAGVAPKPPARKGTVLVVDDSPVNIALARKIFEPSGYEVRAAEGVQVALALARQSPPDVILSDVHMLPLSGLDLVRSVKADPLLKGIPLILISSTSWKVSDQERALALGATKYLVRPIEPQKLLAQIASCLSQGKAASVRPGS